MTVTRRLARWLLPAVAALLVAAPLGAEEPASPSPIDPAQEQAIRQLIREYLLANPEVLIESLQVYRERQQQIQEQKLRQTLVDLRESLVNDPDAPVIGNPDGDVSLVEFFDYRCPYCIRVAPAVREVVESDGNIRLVMKEFPILGPESVTAARMALASVNQGKYEELHFALMTVSGTLTEDMAFKVAKNIGLDVDRLRRDMRSPDIDGMLARNFALAQSLQINGTPGFVIGDEVVRGAIDRAALHRLVANARANSS